MIKAVFDTNIFVSAMIRPHGLPADLLESAIRGRFELFLSKQIIDELSAVLAYPRIKMKNDLNDVAIGVFISLLLKTFPNIGHAPELYVVPNDPKDSPVVSTALACDADYLVTGDKAHILVLGDIGKLRIVSAKEFSDILETT